MRPRVVMACPRGRRLALAFLASLFLPGLGGCLGEPPPPSDPELRAELGIPDHVPIHRLNLSGRGAHTRVIPDRIEIGRGDVVQFVVLDRRVHLIRFNEAAMTTEAIRFLRESGQDAFPPLVEQDARLVLTFEGAPEGSYPFSVEGSGPAVDGEIVVRSGR